MANLPTTYPDPVHIAIIGGTGLGALPCPPFTPLAVIPPPQTPWGTASSPISIFSYTPSSNSTKPTTIAFLARHGPSHSFPPHQIPVRANVAALKKLGVRTVIAFSAVGSLREEVRPRDFCVVEQIVDWTKGVRPWTFFEDGVVGHVGMGDPVDRALSNVVGRALSKEGVLTGEQEGEGHNPKVHQQTGLICIEGPQFSTRAESLLYRSFQTEPPISVINMSAVPECKLFREAEMAYALVCMSTDYDSWHATNEAVSVAMVMEHMKWNGVNAKRAVEAILSALGGDVAEDREDIVVGERLKGGSRGSVMGLGKITGGEGEKAIERLRWLFGDQWITGV